MDEETGLNHCAILCQVKNDTIAGPMNSERDREIEGTMKGLKDRCITSCRDR